MNTWEILHLSPGHQEINLLFIEDVIRAYDIFIKLLIKNAKNCNGKYFQISSPENINLVQLADIFESITEKKLRIKWWSLPYRFRENMKINFFWKKLPWWENETSLKLWIKKLLNI